MRLTPAKLDLLFVFSMFEATFLVIFSSWVSTKQVLALFGEFNVSKFISDIPKLSHHGLNSILGAPIGPNHPKSILTPHFSKGR